MHLTRFQILLAAIYVVGIFGAGYAIKHREITPKTANERVADGFKAFHVGEPIVAKGN
jgi:hypothetical protein